jgi:hypothetical protein
MSSSKEISNRLTCNYAVVDLEQENEIRYISHILTKYPIEASEGEGSTSSNEYINACRRRRRRKREGNCQITPIRDDISKGNTR